MGCQPRPLVSGGVKRCSPPPPDCFRRRSGRALAADNMFHMEHFIVKAAGAQGTENIFDKSFGDATIRTE